MRVRVTTAGRGNGRLRRRFPRRPEQSGRFLPLFRGLKYPRAKQAVRQSAPLNGAASKFAAANGGS